ncbi:MAG: hypothetical protein ACOY3K_05305 [Candidatus Omnitrophota bacterium]
MSKKTTALALALLMVFSFSTPSVMAAGLKEAGASLLLPTTGQAMNDQLGRGKTKIMAAVEVASITTLAILGGVVGGGVTWVALGPLIANHVWSSTDAYVNARNKTNPLIQEQMTEAQRTLEFSRQRRYDREETARSGIRERILAAGEQA